MKTTLIIITISWLYLFIGYIVAGFIAKNDTENLFSDNGEINIGFIAIWPIIIVSGIVLLPFIIIAYLFNK